MDIKFAGKYKSITAFEWLNIPRFSVITGSNGTGKSQLLKLIYNTIVNHPQEKERLQVINETIKRDEVIFLAGEWQLSNTRSTDLASIMQKKNQYFNNFKGNSIRSNDLNQIKTYHVFEEIRNQIAKNSQNVTKEEFDSAFPDFFIERETLLSQVIEEAFYNYRLSEIELKAEGKTESEIINKIGEKPWNILKEVLKESKLPFLFNDPSNNGIRDSFKLQVINEITGDSIDFNDLSSGEKVLISLVFYLYSSQEKNVFPKLLLLDEPDAHLHPTMTQQFLNVIKNVLVDQFNVRVIMTTHSPSTVMLTDESSLFEMSRTSPRIKQSPSKNHTVSLLTSGLVYVGKGTRYFLVEDEDDSNFYAHVYDNLTTENKISADIPLVFIKASTRQKSGGKSVVEGWVKKLQQSGLEYLIQGIIDADNNNQTSQGIYKIARYSIENYLIDPIITYGALMDNDKHKQFLDIGLKVGEEYKLKFTSPEKLQNIADTLFNQIEPLLPDYFPDYNHQIETVRKEVTFIHGIKLQYPEWMIKRKGKTLLNQAYHKKFSHKDVNFTTLFKALQKVNFIPHDMVDLFDNLIR